MEFSQGKTELVVPENSVTHLSGGEGLVLVEEQGKAVTRKVVLGRSAQGKREILEGLILGEKVIANPRSINPGEAVVVREPRTGRELAERNQ
uniref:Uncharacterized protein n=1 Tax=Desertifilum tharense IPPAS B-1220 TaxID=1781255 RepID=A0ACD5GYS5_9CYAN